MSVWQVKSIRETLKAVDILLVLVSIVSAPRGPASVHVLKHARKATPQKLVAGDALECKRTMQRQVDVGRLYSDLQAGEVNKPF